MWQSEVGKAPRAAGRFAAQTVGNHAASQTDPSHRNEKEKGKGRRDGVLTLLLGARHVARGVVC